jgi:hypothetical protein
MSVELNLDNIIAEEVRIREMVQAAYVDPTDRSAPIYDGIVDPAQYISSSPRILWILKEPYDDGDDYVGGGWSLTEDCFNKDTDRTSRKRTFQPSCYINHGIRTALHAWDDMPWLRNCEEMRNSLRKIAFINVSKLPGLKWSPWARIVNAYEKHRQIILYQIKAYAPNLIFACDPHVNLILKDLGLSETDWTWFGSAAAAQISPQQCLIWVGHPSQRACGRGTYVQDAIKAATSASNSMLSVEPECTLPAGSHSIGPYILP